MKRIHNYTASNELHKMRAEIKTLYEKLAGFEIDHQKLYEIIIKSTYNKLLDNHKKKGINHD